MNSPQLEFVTIADPADLYQIREITDIVWPITYRDILSPDQITYMMDKMYAPETMAREFAEGIRFDLLRIDGKNAGYMVFGKYEPGILKLHKLYLLPEYHGRGYGSAMLRHVAAAAREGGFRALRLTVNKHNERALRAYRRNGFRCIESVCTAFGGGYYMDDYIMQLEFATEPDA